MLTAAMALQRSGAGDSSQQTTDIAKTGHDVRQMTLEAMGDNLLSDVVSETLGAATVGVESFRHGVGNYAKGAWNVVSAPFDWMHDHAGPADLQTTVEAANSGCLTHRTAKAQSALYSQGRDRQGNLILPEQSSLFPERRATEGQDHELAEAEQKMLLEFLRSPVAAESGQ